MAKKKVKKVAKKKAKKKSTRISKPAGTIISGCTVNMPTNLEVNYDSTSIEAVRDIASGLREAIEALQYLSRVFVDSSIKVEGGIGFKA